jgi:hypothetical protein
MGLGIIHAGRQKFADFGLRTKLLGVNIFVVRNYVSCNGSLDLDAFVRGRQMDGQWVECVAGYYVVCARIIFGPMLV